MVIKMKNLKNNIKHCGLLLGAAAITLLQSGCGNDSEKGIYPEAPTAVVTQIAPLKGFSGQEVTITGSNFGETRATYVGRVYFGDQEAKYVSWSDNQIVVKAPERGSGDISVWIERNVTKTTSNFECYAGAELTGYSPTDGINKGETLTIECRNLKTFIDLGVKATDVKVTFTSGKETVTVVADQLTEDKIERR